MSRRAFLRAITALGVTFALPVIAKPKIGKLLRTFPVAGFQYHQGEQIWSQLTNWSGLALVREPDNKYDQRAVRIDFRGQKLGYLFRLDNAAVSQLIDRGEQIP